MKENSCCFTGHRNINKSILPKLKDCLVDNILKLIEQGITDFYAGGAFGFDTLASLVIIKLKKTYPRVRLILVLPCLNQTAKWKNEKDIEIYNKILSKADDIVYISNEYTDTCMLERNRYMVDNSSYCICYLNRTFGGTAYTYNYAKDKGSSIINLNVYI